MAFTLKKLVVRSKVLWLGPSADNTEFQRRQLSVEVCETAQALKQLQFAGAIILNVVEGNQSQLVAWLRELTGAAVDHGAVIYIIAANDHVQAHVAHVLKLLGVSSHVTSATNPSLYSVAERVARHEPGPSCRSDLEFRGDAISANAALLLRRSFCDCQSLIVARLTGGATSDVLSVYAEFKDSLPGPRPLPFFAKVGPSAQILDEYRMYEHYVEHFVPFYLRPSLDHQRCVFGFENGVLVGNFVEYSEPLSDVARRNMAQAPIHSLFDHALRGWRLQARPVTKNLLAELPWFVNIAEIPPSRISQAVADGAVTTPAELEAQLRAAPATSHLSGPYHGDLHGENVRVRGSDAILIDFQRVRIGPILADHACLEMSLAFNEFPGDSSDGWSAVIDTLYTPKHFVHPPDPALEPAAREWLWNSVRQIRTIALANQQSETEYLQILAICLLRFARLPNRPTDTAIAEQRKAYAYLVAERLIKVV